MLTSKSVEKHKSHLRLVLSRLNEHGINVNISKCQLVVHSLDFLGCNTDAKGVRLSSERVNFPSPTSINALQRLLGMTNFYHRFLPKLANMLALFCNHLTQTQKAKREPFDWPEPCNNAFQSAKTLLANHNLLAHFFSDSKLTLMTDASDVAIGPPIEFWPFGATRGFLEKVNYDWKGVFCFRSRIWRFSPLNIFLAHKNQVFFSKIYLYKKTFLLTFYKFIKKFFFLTMLVSDLSNKGRHDFFNN